MSFKSNVRISKLQAKNKMVGKTFNPRGWTIESLDKRDDDFLIMFNKMTKEEKENKIKTLKKLVEICKKKGWSYPYEYNLLKNRRS